jgi:hypothetical protein
MPSQKRFMHGGTIVGFQYGPDGVDLHVKEGCGRRDCPNCRGGLQCWTKVAPCNWRFAVGDAVWWRGCTLYWLPGGPYTFRRPTLIRRVGVYRLVRSTAGKGGGKEPPPHGKDGGDAPNPVPNQ